VKVFKKILLVIILLVIFIPIFALGYMGLIPGLSTIMGTDKPRDLGIKYTQEDLKSVRSKSKLEYKSLPETSVPSQTRQFAGKRDVSAEFTSAEITATLNNQPWKYWPYRNVQIKFNGDGSGEISGVLVKSKLSGYAAVINAPKEAIDFAMKFLPSDPVFYVKMRASLAENKVDNFEPRDFEIGRMPMPLNMFLSMGGINLIKSAYAQNPQEMSQELSKVQNKRQLIIDFINEKLSSDFGQFFARKAYFEEGKLFFEGSLTESISYTP
jgi:hypothetical protein